MNKSPAIFLLAAILFLTRFGVLWASDSGESVQQRETRILTIQEVVRMALARSPEVLLADTQVHRSHDALRETRSLNRLQVYTGTGLAYNNGYPLSMEGAAPSIIQVSASQSIFSKKNSNLIREAEESGKATRLGADSVRNELASRTALVYFRLYKSRRCVDIASGRLLLTQKQQQEVETLFSAGRVRPLDVSVARNSTVSARQQLLSAQEEATLAEIELREITGLPSTVSIKVVEPHLENPAFHMEGGTLFLQAIQSAPEILQSEANVKAKEYHVEAEKGERLPRAEIIGQYALFSKANNYEDFFSRFSRNNFIIGLSLQVPIFDSFRTSSKIAQSRQEVSEARYRLDSQKSDLRISLERRLSALRIARGESDLARSDVDVARETVKVNEALLEEGRLSPKEMGDSRLLLQQKELVLLEADQVLFQRKLELLLAIGSASSTLQ
jgi:outer membrane protein